ncbi:hypothetical protein M426DRAFT_266956 [Hypoxylon sp. CI-4A]|nr:hypothetical protein M426DRAFT_266956 [Hypoxylon sp. CI-4A]
MVKSNDSRRPSSSLARMPFIVSSNMEKVDPTTRKLIRSHARRGKKTKGSRATKDQHFSGKAITGYIKTDRVKLDEVIEVYVPLTPGRIGPDLYFIEFTDVMEPSIYFNLLEVTRVVKRIVSPLKAVIGFEAEVAKLNSPFGRDAAALHVLAFAVQGFVDRVLRRQEGSINPVAILHLQKGLRLLRERLLGMDDETKISDSTMSIVLKLASVAHFDGDYQTSRHHMEGLRKIVDLRGGLGVFGGTMLLVEMMKSDLGIALLNGSNPVFFSRPSEPVAEYPEKLLPTSSDDKMHGQDDIDLIQIADNDLGIAWRVMKRFCLFVNLGMQTQRLIHPELICETMIAVMYRLLHMGFADGSIDEAIRLGLLAFSYHVFLQWQDIKPTHAQFHHAYKTCILNLSRTDGIPSRLTLWLSINGCHLDIRHTRRSMAKRFYTRTGQEMRSEKLERDAGYTQVLHVDCRIG